MRRILALFLCLALELTAGIHQQAAKDYKVDRNQQHVLEMAQELPQVGVLKTPVTKLSTPNQAACGIPTLARDRLGPIAQ